MQCLGRDNIYQDQHSQYHNTRPATPVNNKGAFIKYSFTQIFGFIYFRDRNSDYVLILLLISLLQKI